MKSLGDRMKMYEKTQNHTLMKKVPVIVRLDGKAFHTYTKRMNFNKPFCDTLKRLFTETTIEVCSKIQGCKMAYHQSDEVSFLLSDMDDHRTESYFNYNVQKLTSIIASMFTAHFNEKSDGIAYFDARAFTIPLDELNNYFIWRQQDATRNSVQMVARHHYSHKECQGKNNKELQSMLLTEKDVNWNDTPPRFKRGSCVIKDDDGKFVNDYSIPIFTEDREYILYQMEKEKEAV